MTSHQMPAKLYNSKFSDDQQENWIFFATLYFISKIKESEEIKNQNDRQILKFYDRFFLATHEHDFLLATKPSEHFSIWELHSQMQVLGLTA